MEARMNRIEEEVKRISSIEASIDELRSEVKMMIRGLAQRLDEQLLHHCGIASLSCTKVSDPSDLVLFEGFPTFGEPEPHPSVTEVLDPPVPTLLHPVQQLTKVSMLKVSQVQLPVPSIHHVSDYTSPPPFQTPLSLTLQTLKPHLKDLQRTLVMPSLTRYPNCDGKFSIEMLKVNTNLEPKPPDLRFSVLDFFKTGPIKHAPLPSLQFWSSTTRSMDFCNSLMGFVAIPLPPWPPPLYPRSTSVSIVVATSVSSFGSCSMESFGKTTQRGRCVIRGHLMIEGSPLHRCLYDFRESSEDAGILFKFFLLDWN
ncbi:hypothetical protein Scep_020261 [Stephania cephalantha]|uniref:Uncharacterized protein n=1 Tax=Stephania cephalantha TaxID=152367 RepID=A0AAP0ICZ7_9MAGN